MGWKYSYFVLLSPIDLKVVNEKGKSLRLADFTEVAKKASEFEVESRERLQKLLERGNASSGEIVDAITACDDESVRRFLDATNPFSDLGFYSLSFHKFRGFVVVTFVSARWDVGGDWAGLALALLSRLGYSGEVLFVSRNSVTDSVSVVKILISNRCRTLSTVHGEEGKYLETLGSFKDVPLLDIHRSFDKEKTLLLVLGKYLDPKHEKNEV